MKLAVIGSRNYPKLEQVEARMRTYAETYGNLVIVSGGARGVDQEARRVAKEVLALPYIEYLPDWHTHGKRAGFLRNVQIIDASDVVLAFWDGKSKGTEHSLKLAMGSHKPVEVILPHEVSPECIRIDLSLVKQGRSETPGYERRSVEE